MSLPEAPTAEIIRLTAVDLASKIKSGELSAVEVTQAHLDRIADVDGTIHAFLYVDGERALRSATRVDAKIAALAGLDVDYQRSPGQLMFAHAATPAGSQARHTGCGMLS